MISLRTIKKEKIDHSPNTRLNAKTEVDLRRRINILSESSAKRREGSTKDRGADSGNLREDTPMLEVNSDFFLQVPPSKKKRRATFNQKQ
jgi:hypothetical protein